MRSSLWLAALWVGLSVASAGEPTQGGDQAKKGRVDELIQRLNSNKFADRERASAELEKLGLDALEPLKKVAAAKDTDQETRSRAEKLLARLNRKRESEIILAPTRLRLNLKDAPVAEAVNQLAKLSRYSIVLQGDTSKLAGRKITLDTGETTFWRAFDQLCEQGGLGTFTVTTSFGPNVNVPFGMPGVIGPPGAAPAPQPIPIRVMPLRPKKAVPVPDNVAPPPPPKKDKEAKAPPQALALAPVFLVQLPAERNAIALPQQAPGRPAIQIAPAGGFRPGVMPGGPAPLGQIIVTADKAEKCPTHHAGALRFRIVPYDRNTMGSVRVAAKGEALLILEVCAEPKLTNFRVLSGLRVDRAVDDQGQTLSVAPEQTPAAGGTAAAPWQQVSPYAGANRALLSIRLKRGEKQAKALKELAGSVTTECLSPPQELLAIDDVLKAAGKSAKGKDGGALELLEISKQDNGEIRLRVRQETSFNPPGVIMPGAQVKFIRGRGRVVENDGMPALVDAKGKAYQLVQIPTQTGRGNGNALVQEMTMVFRPHDGQGEPARLVLHGRRIANVQAAFTFTDVPLP